MKVTKVFKFCAGHRLLNYEGKCKFPHGHNYEAEVEVEGNLDKLGMVMDFSDLKRVVSDWIDTRWDHGFLLNSRDEEMAAALGSLKHSKVFYFKEQNPTAEAMADVLLGELSRDIPGVVRVRITETDGCWAEVTR